MINEYHFQIKNLAHSKLSVELSIYGMYESMVRSKINEFRHFCAFQNLSMILTKKPNQRK